MRRYAVRGFGEERDMIPSLMLVGLIVGVFPRPWFWFGLAMSAVLWTLVIAFSGPDVRLDPGGELFTFLIAAVNTGAGIIVARLLVHLVHAATSRIRS